MQVSTLDGHLTRPDRARSQAVRDMDRVRHRSGPWCGACLTLDRQTGTTDEYHGTPRAESTVDPTRSWGGFPLRGGYPYPVARSLASVAKRAPTPRRIHYRVPAANPSPERARGPWPGYASGGPASMNASLPPGPAHRVESPDRRVPATPGWRRCCAPQATTGTACHGNWPWGGRPSSRSGSRPPDRGKTGSFVIRPYGTFGELPRQRRAYLGAEASSCSGRTGTRRPDPSPQSFSRISSKSPMISRRCSHFRDQAEKTPRIRARRNPHETIRLTRGGGLPVTAGRAPKQVAALRLWRLTPNRCYRTCRK